MSGCQRRCPALMLTPMLGRLAIGKTSLRRTPQFVALLAMLVQFALSFGHFDTQDFAALRSGHQPLTIANAQGVGGGTGQGLTGDFGCPICSSIQLLGSTAVPDGTRLRLPEAQHSGIALAVAALWLTPPPHLLFDTRGPPVV
jgi:hypothetical protein